MILYLDTSDLLKLYVRESDSQRVDENAARAEQLASSLLAYVEMRSAFARALRDKRIPSANAYSAVVQRFQNDWRQFAKIDVTASHINLAGEMAERHGLRAGDALHLAFVLFLRSQSVKDIRFSVADSQLRSGAISEGFVVV